MILPETDAEHGELRKAAQTAHMARVSREVGPHRAELVKRLGGQLSANFELCHADCATVVDKDLARRRLPEVFDREDKDGLVPITGLRVKAPGVFEEGGLLLFAHPFLRRSLSRLNTLNSPFLEVLHSLKDEEGLSSRIALDSDMLGLASTFRDHIELAYWWGPKFSDDLASIPTGVTRHESSDRQRYFHGISHTEFGWYEQNGNQTFECEELRNIETLGTGESSFGCRFVHSIVDPATKLPFHLDGAIRMYDDATMVSRFDTDIKTAGRRARYTKLWRLDGQIPVSIWKELIANYYRDNELVGEYFGGKEEDALQLPTPELAEETSSPSFKSVPSNLMPSQGVHIAISYHPLAEQSSSGRHFLSLDSFTSGNDRIDYLESDTLDLVKLLRRSGEAIQLPHNFGWVAFEDLILNLPLVLHTGPDATTLAKGTLRAVGQFCQAAVARKLDKTVAFHLGVQFQDRNVYFSFAGHVEALCRWLEMPAATLPCDGDAMGRWADVALGALSTAFPNTTGEPQLWNLLQTTGLLVFDRRILKPDEFSVSVNETTSEIVFEAQVTGPDLPLAESNGLQPAAIILISESTCSACHQPYEECNCIKILDDTVTQSGTRCEPLGFFLTNCKA